MAIKNNVIYKGIPINNAYIRIWRYEGDKEKMHFEAGVHASKDAEMITSQGYRISLNLDGANPIKQAYEYLKSLPEFSDAVDC
jgi:hypothetical protein